MGETNQTKIKNEIKKKVTITKRYALQNWNGKKGERWKSLGC